ncbi:LOW QUALITY PROTEIN: olfactory receptor 10G9-like [Rhinophrynus dorsalis]
MANQSHIFEFVLIGFPGLQQMYHVPVSTVMYLVYNISLIANGTVIIMITYKKLLHQPMYIIIGNLALSDLLFDTITLPKMIATYWFGAGSIAFSACIFQLFCVHYLGTLDSFIIMLMSFDRYVAITKPLRYHSIISNKLTSVLCCFLWVFAALIGSVVALIAVRLPYCGPNKVKNCFCVNSAVTVLACMDVTSVRQIVFIIAMVVLLVPLAFIILSYVLIIKSIHSSSRSVKWQKAFYTCTTHLFVIGLYYIPRVFVYTSSQVRLILDADVNVLLLCLYTFIPHLANPIIYCLRNKDIKIILERVFKIRFGVKIGHRSSTLH